MGATTGPGGAIDNTIYSGTLTSAPTLPADVPTADDFQLVDTGIPVSWTASGMLAPGVVFKRTNGAARYWWPLKDLGAKTLRVTSPMSNLAANSVWNGGALANGDAYSAYQLPTYYSQDFGASAVNVTLQDLYEQTAASANLASIVGLGTQRLRVDTGGTLLLALASQWTNCLIRLSASRFGIVISTSIIPVISGGGAIGTGATVLTIAAGTIQVLGCWVSQGVPLVATNGANVQFLREWAMHDCTVPCLQATTQRAGFSAQISTAGQGMSGKGNTGKLVSATIGGGFYYGSAGAAPPFNTACTTDGTPVTIGGVSYAVALLPVVADTFLTPSVTKNVLP